MKTSAPRIALTALLLLIVPVPAVATSQASGVRIQLEVTGEPTEGPTTDPEDPGPTDTSSGPSPEEPGSPSPSGTRSTQKSTPPADPLSRTGTEAATLALWGVAALAAGGAVLRIRHHRTSAAAPDTHQE